jgi:hypothetical protein
MPASLPTICRRIESEPEPGTASAVAAPTHDYHPFLVQCDTYRCLAYRDKNGTWRAMHDNRELTNFKTVLCPLR